MTMPRIQYEEVNYKYKLTRMYAITIKRFKGCDAVELPYLEMYDGVLMIHSKYMWDGASGPAIDTKSFMRASLVHDALYQLLRKKALPPEMRKAADKVMYDICREDGMSWMRAQWVYRAVRWGGENAAKPKKPESIA